MYSFIFAKDLSFETWEATNGFLHRFCMQFGVLSKHITGKSFDCPDYAQFMKEVLTPLLMEYEPQDVYNADETSLYYKSLADRTFAFEHERVHVHVLVYLKFLVNWLNIYNLVKLLQVKLLICFFLFYSV